MSTCHPPNTVHVILSSTQQHTWFLSTCHPPNNTHGSCHPVIHQTRFMSSCHPPNNTHGSCQPVIHPTTHMVPVILSSTQQHTWFLSSCHPPNTVHVILSSTQQHTWFLSTCHPPNNTHGSCHPVIHPTTHMVPVNLSPPHLIARFYHAFVDFKKAFDRVWHAALWATMRL